MVYVVKEYEAKFDTPQKKEQERAIVSKIMTLLNNNKYNNLDDFNARNPDYQTFLRNNNYGNVMKHFGNTLTDADYKIIVENLKTLTAKKQAFEKEGIKETQIGDKAFATLTASDSKYYVDNTGQKPIEEQMNDLQRSQESFQTSDPRKNTDNMFKELHNSVKTSINPEALSQIDTIKLSEDEKRTYDAAVQYQERKNRIDTKVDVSKNVLIDENGEIKRINTNGDKIEIQGENNTETLEDNTKEDDTKGYQKTLALNPYNLSPNN